MPHQHTAEVLWLRGAQDFLGHRYGRKHLLRFDGGIEVPGSSSPLPMPMPLPMSDAAAVDPEKAFASSLSSCHIPWFLASAAKRKFCVGRYFDAAVGVMGKIAMIVVTLRLEIHFPGERLPSRERIDQMHHTAHEECHIVNSVKSELRCEPLYIAL